MACGFKDHPLMLAIRRYAKWQSRFMRYVYTKPNSKELKLCILEGPYVMTKINDPSKPTTKTEDAVPSHKVPETYKNMSPENHAYFDAKAEGIHMILSGTGDDIYLIVDACTIAQEMWVAIERLQQSESLNKQDVKTNLFWNENQTGQFRNRRTVVGARETLGNQVVQQTRIQCFNFKEFRHLAKESRKPKRAKDYTYHKEKMMLCKREKKGVPLSAEHDE
nr:hypothetical protein [Tanacetum cinerariifolium]